MLNRSIRINSPTTANNMNFILNPEYFGNFSKNKSKLCKCLIETVKQFCGAEIFIRIQRILAFIFSIWSWARVKLIVIILRLFWCFDGGSRETTEYWVHMSFRSLSDFRMWQHFESNLKILDENNQTIKFNFVAILLGYCIKTIKVLNVCILVEYLIYFA